MRVPVRVCLRMREFVQTDGHARAPPLYSPPPPPLARAPDDDARGFVFNAPPYFMFALGILHFNELVAKAASHMSLQ